MNIAVIGGGIAGLVAAWRLSQRHVVTLFERHAQPGFVASSVTLPAARAGAGSLRVDVPLRVFFPGYYPTLTRLYAELGVATEAVDYATTLTDDHGRAYFRWRNARLGGWSLPYVLPQDLVGARARRIVQGALRFQRLARSAAATGALAGLSVGEFVADEGFSPDFVEGLLLPTLATIATCTTEDARHYPAEVAAAYAAAGMARQSVHRARDGADAVAARLLAGITRVHCLAGVTGVRRERGAARVHVQRGEGVETFDHVVLATQANQALALLQDGTAAERTALAAFHYRALEVVMHRDPALMPARRADWSPVNARVSAAYERPQSTIWLNRVQPSLQRAAALFQTVMPQQQPREELVLSRARFERPLVDSGSAAAIAALQRLHGQRGRRVWFCGSYAEAGVPLLESAVRSALAVAAAVDATAVVPVAGSGRRAKSMA